MNLNDKTILVTGADGFLGKHVVDVLQARGYSKVYTSGFRDLRQPENVAGMYARHKPNIVINLAARVGGIAANLAKPGEFFYDNLMIGVTMLDGARKIGTVEKFVQIGSACEYPKNALMPMGEWDIWNGYPEKSNAAYGIAKRALLTMGQAYREQWGMNVIHLVPTNLYGPGDNFSPETSHVVSALIRKFYEAKKFDKGSVKIWGTGEATRDFLYVKDAAEGIVKMTEVYGSAQPLNLGSGLEYSISFLSRTIKELIGYEGTIVWDETQPEGQPRRWLNTSEARSRGYNPVMDLRQGVKETIEYYKNWADSLYGSAKAYAWAYEKLL
jgi:nucleoside-diphosphate-sugar epimerase